MTRRVAVATGAVLLCAAPLPAPAAERDGAARRGAEYLVAHQGADGSFFEDTAPHRVAENVLALVAGGVDKEPVALALDAMAAGGPDAARRAGEAGLLVMGIVAAGEDPRAFRGGDYVARLHSFYNAGAGTYDTQQFQNALALLGVVAAGDPLPAQAITFLRVSRCTDGGIPVQAPCGGAGGHVDVTALVLSALAGTGMDRNDPLRADARSFLLAAQNGEGGYGDTKGRTTNANSTGLVLAAVAALGESATAAPWRQADGDDPVQRLLALQQADGRFHQSATVAGDTAMATRQAVPGMAGRSYPVRPRTTLGGRPPGVPRTTTTRPNPHRPTSRSDTTTTTTTTAGLPVLGAARVPGVASTQAAHGPVTFTERHTPRAAAAVGRLREGDADSEHGAAATIAVSVWAAVAGAATRAIRKARSA